MRTAAATVLACFALRAAAAPAADDVAVVAAARLAEKASYSWSSAISNDASGGFSRIDGQTVRGGYTLLLPRNVSDVLRNRGAVRDADGVSQAFFRGSNRCVILTDQGWLAPEELPPAQTSTERSQPRNPAAARGGRNGGRVALSSIPTQVDDFNFEIRHPHEDLDLIIGSYTTLRAAGESFTGELTDAGAALFLSAFAQPKVEVRRATGSFHCWIENGVVVRYEIVITGTVNLPGDRNPLPVNWTIRTEIHSIGTTRVTVPTAVRAKLG